MIIKDIDYRNIDFIKEIWEQNRDYHKDISSNFSEIYEKLIFEERIKYFEQIEKKNIKITVLVEEEKCLGYCISTIINSIGEIQSLHILNKYRGLGYGKKLMKESLKWLEKNNCESIGVNVSCENIKTIKFYENFGFFRNTIYMQKK